MGVEIERKFLVDKAKWEAVKPLDGTRIVQGYLSKSLEKTIRIRVKENQGFITIKGKTKGISRLEYEYEIPVTDAQELLANFCPKKIDKIRYKFDYKGSIWEVDEFITPNTGLILAEIELISEEQSFSRPIWIGKEVSDQAAYYNVNML